MMATEKELIFNLLKTASANVAGGFVPPNFASTPVFKDDEAAASANANISSPAEPEKLSSQVAAQQPATPESTTATASFASDESATATASFVSDESETAKISSVSPAPAKNALSIEDITSKILRCTHCQLARTRTNVVPGEGVPHPDVLVIGEGPCYDEDMQGRPFVGKAGMLLDKMLVAINLDRRTNCFIANVVKCRPPQNRDPFPEEQAACFSFLEAQIRILSPKMILCMGRISAQKLLNTEEGVGRLRGNFFEYNGIPLMVTYHPSALLRNQDLKRPAWEDLKKFRTRLDELTGGSFSANGNHITGGNQSANENIPTGGNPSANENLPTGGSRQ